MKSEPNLKRRLLTGYVLFGLLNLLVITGFVYFQTRQKLLDRAQDHMASVRSLARSKLSLYLESKKEPLTEAASRILHQREGLGQSGEIYLVGEDHRIKSASRFIDRWAHVTVKNEAVVEGLSGETGTTTVKDYRGVEVISSYIPFSFDGMNYVLLAEIDLKEVLAPLNEVAMAVALMIMGLILLNFIMAAFATRGILHQIQVMKARINEFNRETIHVQERERESIAYHLHDSVGQYLTALKWGLAQLRMGHGPGPQTEKIIELEGISENMVQDIRSLSHDLMPSLLKDFGLLKAIEQYLSDQRRHYDLIIHWNPGPGLSELALRQDFAVNLYRMIQELVQNAVKHAEAQALNLGLSVSAGELLLTYADDGRGLKSDAPLPRSLQYRTTLFSGKLQRAQTPRGLSLSFTFTLSDVTHDKD